MFHAQKLGVWPILIESGLVCHVFLRNPSPRWHGSWEKSLNLHILHCHALGRPAKARPVAERHEGFREKGGALAGAPNGVVRGNARDQSRSQCK